VFYQLAHPTRFLNYARPLKPWLGIVTLLLFAIGLWQALFVSPPDYQHGDTVRIMYVHVPASWFALSVYVLVALTHGIGHIWKHPLADLTAKAIAPIGLCFTVLSLATGALWGKPMWGAWWVWDARLTSMFILMLLYIGYMLLINAYEDPQYGLKAAGVLSLIGVINIPIIKWSVNWWNTLHQPASLTKLSAPSLHHSFIWPLMLMAAAYFSLLLWVGLIRLETEILRRKRQALRTTMQNHHFLESPQREEKTC
jgi:heme exporter protein C